MLDWSGAKLLALRPIINQTQWLPKNYISRNDLKQNVSAPARTHFVSFVARVWVFGLNFEVHHQLACANYILRFGKLMPHRMYLHILNRHCFWHIHFSCRRPDVPFAYWGYWQCSNNAPVHSYYYDGSSDNRLYIFELCSTGCFAPHIVHMEVFLNINHFGPFYSFYQNQTLD